MHDVMGLSVEADKCLQSKHPDVAVSEEKKKNSKINNLALPGEQNMKSKEQEKVFKYQDLHIEIEKHGLLKLLLL